MKRLKGFTLSEIMVALAVIGVLVAVVTPVIMQTKPNKNKMMVKKSFYTIEQVVSSLINDEHLYPDMRENCEGSDLTNCAWGFDYDDAVKSEGMEYKGDYKFAALFKEKLNVAKEVVSSKVSGAGPDSGDFYPVFYTSDGIKWDFTGTKGAWTSGKERVGTFADPTNAAGFGVIKVDVNGDDKPNLYCTDANQDCDIYEVQILASGKLRIDPTYTRAVNWATINTAVKD